MHRALDRARRPGWSAHLALVISRSCGRTSLKRPARTCKEAKRDRLKRAERSSGRPCQREARWDANGRVTTTAHMHAHLHFARVRIGFFFGRRTCAVTCGQALQLNEPTVLNFTADESENFSEGFEIPATQRAERRREEHFRLRFLPVCSSILTISYR